MLTLGHWPISAALQAQTQTSKSVGKGKQRQERKEGNVRKEKMMESYRQEEAQSWLSSVTQDYVFTVFISQMFFRQTSASPTPLPFCGFHAINNQSSGKVLLHPFHFELDSEKFWTLKKHSKSLGQHCPFINKQIETQQLKAFVIASSDKQPSQD